MFDNILHAKPTLELFNEFNLLFQKILLCVSSVSRCSSRFFMDRILLLNVLNIIKRPFYNCFFFFWDLWDLSRLFVRINFASRCRITSIFNRASFTLLGAQVYFLWITNFDNKFSCFAINSINKHVEWQWQQNQGIIIALKNLFLLLILFFVNARGVHRNYVLGTCFLTETCYLLWD